MDEKYNDIIKNHNKSLLMYHFVCPAKYSRVVFTNEVEQIYEDIRERFDIYPIEIGSDEDHVHFLL